MAWLDGCAATATTAAAREARILPDAPGHDPARAGASSSQPTPEERIAALQRELVAVQAEVALCHTILESATGYAIFTIDPQARVTSWNAGAANLLRWGEAEALGLDSRLLFTPEDRARGAVEAEIAKAMAEGRAEDERWHLRRDGSRFWASGLLVPLRGGPERGFLKILRDRTAERRAEVALRERNERLELLSEVAAQLISGDEPDAVLARLFHSVSERLGVDVCFNFAVEAPGRTLRLGNYLGIDEAMARRLARVEFGQAVCGTVAATRRAAHLAEVPSSSDPNAAEVRELGVRAYACYPLEAGGQLLGTLSFGSRARDRFAPDDLAFFQTISHHVAAVKGRKRTEAALRASEARFRSMVERISDAFLTLDRDWRVTYANPRVGQEAGHRVLDLLGRDVREALPALRGSEVEQACLDALSDRSPVQLEVRSPWGDRWLLLSIYPAEQGLSLFWLDVTERKEAEARQGLLLRELSHRVKNTLALILAMARRMGQGTPAAAEFLGRFEGRLRALSTAHELLTESGWRPTSLLTLAQAALAPHDGPGGGQIRVEIGADLPLKPAAAQDLVLVLHELATNAAKHGALSVSGGTVVLAGQVADGELALVWREAGGPVAAPPPASGFGITLLQQAVVHQYGGRAAFDWQSNGLVSTLRLPVAKVSGVM
jgi:PAS domain S-box-containing protein